MHLSTHNPTINVEHLHSQENEYRHGDNAFDDVPAHSKSSDIDSESMGPLPNNDPPPLLQRIEHPHLNGKFSAL